MRYAQRGGYTPAKLMTLTGRHEIMHGSNGYPSLRCPVLKPCMFAVKPAADGHSRPSGTASCSVSSSAYCQHRLVS